jgi:hypothetical protein
VHEAEPPPPPPTPPPAHEPSPFAPAPVAAEPARPAETPHASAWYRDTLGDGLVVAGIASGVAGVILYQKARTDLDDAEHAGSLAQYNQLVDDAHSTRTISIVLVGGGAVFVGAGLAHYAFHGRAESHGVVVAPARGGGIVTWTGGF